MPRRILNSKNSDNTVNFKDINIEELCSDNAGGQAEKEEQTSEHSTNKGKKRTRKNKNQISLLQKVFNENNGKPSKDVMNKLALRTGLKRQ